MPALSELIRFMLTYSKIETEEENEHALEMVNVLMTKGEKNLTDEERQQLRILVRLIESFEEKAYPMGEASPDSPVADSQTQLYQ